MNKYTVISNLIQFFGKSNTQTPAFKKTSRDFKRKYGIDFVGAPVVFKKDGIVWKLQYICTSFKGRKVESASYIPVADVKTAWSSISRTDITV